MKMEFSLCIFTMNFSIIIKKVYVKQKLQFRSYEQVVKDLEYAGLKVLACYCNWWCVPFMEISDEKLMIFVAVKNSNENL